MRHNNAHCFGKHMLLLVALQFLPLATQAGWVLYDNIYYQTFSDYTAKVVADPNGMKYSGDVEIQSEVTFGPRTYNVIAIEDDAFKDCVSDNSK